MHLRIEDIDQARARAEWERAIYDDLRWLGLSWPEPVMRQSQRLSAYRGALSRLMAMGLLYPCTCKRRDILQAADAPQEGVVHGPDGPVYPGTCRPSAPFTGAPPEGAALRLDMRRALALLGDAPLAFHEMEEGPEGQTGEIRLRADDLVESVGDVVLARRDWQTSYHLSVVVDDASQGVSDVTRGRDLFEATAIHVVLQALLRLPTPRYHHHRLIRDEAGKRLAKRDDARAIALYREEGARPEDVRAMVGL